MNKFYKASINRVVNYIQANLGEDLSFKQLSEVAYYSKESITDVALSCGFENSSLFAKSFFEKSIEILKPILEE